MKIWVTGGSGVLGTAVIREAHRLGHELAVSGHSVAIEDEASVIGFAEQHNPDAIINCAGQLPGSDPLDMLDANTVGPHVLAALGIRLVHMSTDCVFSGRSSHRWISSHDLPDPDTIYGRSKRAGELEDYEHCLTVRGSFISPEGGFLKWLLSARGAIDSWSRAYWNGTSAARMAGVLIEMAGYSDRGIAHVASSTMATKAELIQRFYDELDLPISVIRVTREPELFRVLEPDYDLGPLEDSLRELLIELKAPMGVV